MLAVAALALSLCPVVHIRDGDTFVCQSGEVVRLVDIDAPELRSRCPAERALAIRARNRLAELVRGGVTLYRLGRDRDRWNRALRVVVRVRDNRSLGDILVSEGLPRTWTGRRQPWC